MSDGVKFCSARIFHARTRPVANRFIYQAFCLRVRVDDPHGLARAASWLFGVDRRRAVSFHASDHGARDRNVPLMQWLRETLDVAGLTFAIGEVWLQAFPRVLGYVFNPVSFWFVHDVKGALRVLVADVNNTFGERHQYLLTAPGQASISSETELVCQKLFHVSPFFDTQGEYRFRLRTTDGVQSVAIDYYTDGEPTPALRTRIDCRAQALTTARLIGALLRMPFMTFGVVARIHWQAFKLWRAGVGYRKKPRPPELGVTHNRSRAHHEY